MGRKTFTAEQIIFKLREVEVLVGQGGSIANACRKIAVTEQTYYRWRKEYGGTWSQQSALEQEAMNHIRLALNREQAFAGITGETDMVLERSRGLGR